MALTNEQLTEAVEALQAAGGVTAQAARNLGMSRKTLEYRLEKAALANVDGHPTLATQAAPGFKLAGYSQYWSAEKGFTGEWVKFKKEDERFQSLIEAIKDELGAYRGLAPEIAPPKLADADKATIYVVADPHLGLFSWAEETDENYDLKIASRVLRTTASNLIQGAQPSGVGVILSLGDFFHADTNAWRTEKSGNELDGDGRVGKVNRAGVRLMIDMVELALKKHERVVVRMLPGNHDPKSSPAIELALSVLYENNPRVEVQNKADPFFMWQFGKCMVAAAHGDQVKPQDFPGVMASYWPKVWGDTMFRYAYFGHLHSKHKGGGEHHGVEWEVFQALTAKDAWARGMGYSSGRSMSAITLHKDRGEIGRQREPILPRQYE